MGAPKILIFLFILVVISFAIRLGAPPPQDASSMATSTRGMGGIASSTVIKPAPPKSPSVKPPVTTVSTPPQPAAPAIPSYEIPAGFKLEQLSPYFHKIRFSNVSRPGDINLAYSSYYSGTENKPINVTGWTIRARAGGTVIPQAINIFDPSGLGTPTDIYMKSNDYLRLYSSTSAIGQNFRLNKCIGYLENENNFTPQLPGYCPRIYRDSEITGFSGKCKDYIYSIPSCSVPNLNSADIRSDDYVCREFVQRNASFRGCFDKYRGDPDFLGNEIWVWAGNKALLDDRHDQVLLLDRAGLVVDVYTY